MNKIINYKNIYRVTIIIIVTVLFLILVYKFSIFYLLIPFFFYTSFTIWGTFSIDSQFYTHVICNFDTENEIALTFDDGPNPETTEKILDILKYHQIKASFFCVGTQIEKYPEIFQRIVNEKHTIGNHTWSHHNFFAFLSYKKVLQEIVKTNAYIYKYTNKSTILFRPPVGILNPIIAKVCKNMNLKIIGWNLRSLDTVKSKSKVLIRLSKVKAGDIVLLHDNRQSTPEILEEFIGIIAEIKLKCTDFNEIVN